MLHVAIDYTGNVYSPMRLPLLSDLDPRKPESPWWSIRIFVYLISLKNLRFTGIKICLTGRQTKETFIIARTNDPFDKNVIFDANGQVVPTTDNPYALTFDPSYVYTPNQGIRAFLGVRFKLN